MLFKLRIIWNLWSLKYYKWKYQGKVFALQNKRWIKLQKILPASPFYAELSKRKAPLAEYPIMNKAAFMENFDLINTRGLTFKKTNEIARKAELSRDFSPMLGEIAVGLSSGTSGNQSIFLSSSKERAQWVSAILDNVLGLSFRPRSVAFFLRANNNLYTAVQSKLIQFEFFDLLIPIHKHIERLNDLEPSLLLAQPSALLELALFVKTGQLAIQPEKIISVAEVLYPEDRAILENAFGKKIHQVYQCTEGFLASTCAYGTLHFHEDFIQIEKKYIDDEQSRFHPIITDLLRETQPIIRYELNDIILEKQNCPCGSKYLGIEQIEGRSDDILLFEEHDRIVKIFPDFFRRAIILSDPNITDYTLVQKSKTEIEIYVNGQDNYYQSAVAAINNLLAQNGIQNVEIKRANGRHHEIGFKLRRIINATK